METLTFALRLAIVVAFVYALLPALMMLFNGYPPRKEDKDDDED